MRTCCPLQQCLYAKWSTKQSMFLKTPLLYFVLFFVNVEAWGKQQELPFHLQGRQQTEGAVSLDGGLVGQNAGGSSRSCPFPDPHASKSSLDFWRFHRQNFSAPPLGTLCIRWLEKCHPLLRHIYIVLMYVCMYVCSLCVLMALWVWGDSG